MADGSLAFEGLYRGKAEPRTSVLGGYAVAFVARLEFCLQIAVINLRGRPRDFSTLLLIFLQNCCTLILCGNLFLVYKHFRPYTIEVR